jgi:asparagine synthase (glutamine-hydrolysing)
MCGICGEFRRDGGEVSRETIEAMTAMLAHRGPDASGYRFVPPFLGLGHRRLSIIDLPGGSQPMSNEDGSVWVVFNGEIYNFPELRAELMARGHVFHTNSDTEVIVHQYEEDGPDCVQRFNGMFALAVWDAKSRRLFLARDRLGVKPLYFTEDGSRFIFASELRPLLRALPSRPELSAWALWSYLAIQYVPGPDTLFAGIRELMPGHRLLVDTAGVRDDAYWRLPERPEPITGAAAEEAVRELLADAVRLRLISDVPLGAFLSGGIDSTALVAFMRRFKGAGLQTFSVDFHAELGAEAVNETEWSRLAAREFATEHHALTVSAAEAVAALPEVAARLDDLISDPAIIPTYLVSRFARETVTVALSGEGGDELFGGYQRYALGGLARFYQPLPRPLRGALEGAFARLPRMRRVRKGLKAIGELTPARRHLAWLLVMPPELIDRMLAPGNDGEDRVRARFDGLFAGQVGAFDLDRTLRADLQTWLPDDLLTKVDRASMAVGLEARTPFLDYRLVELALRIPAAEKVGLCGRKLVFKRAMRGIVPAAIVNRPKSGFALPLDAWFRRELKEMLQDLLSPARLSRQGLFHPAAVEGLVREHLSGREDQGHPLFSLLLFQLWQDSMKV